MAPAFFNTLTVTIPATIIPILVAAFSPPRSSAVSPGAKSSGAREDQPQAVTVVASFSKS
ncbi:MAG: hypothetical protein AAFP13_01110 [Pseudomonadota bacterium]